MLSLLDVTENLIQSEHKNWEYSINFFDAFCRICKLSGKDKITIIPNMVYQIPYTIYQPAAARRRDEQREQTEHKPSGSGVLCKAE